MHMYVGMYMFMYMFMCMNMYMLHICTYLHVCTCVHSLGIRTMIQVAAAMLFSYECACLGLGLGLQGVGLGCRVCSLSSRVSSASMVFFMHSQTLSGLMFSGIQGLGYSVFRDPSTLNPRP